MRIRHPRRTASRAAALTIGLGWLLGLAWGAVGASPASDDGLESFDPIFALQWHHEVLDTPSAWLVSRGAGTTVAVIDSGVMCDHPDLAGQCVDGWDFVAEEPDAADDWGTGTHLAGIIAAVADNGIGVAGVAPAAKIMPLKVLDAQGAGDIGRVARALAFAADRGADVAVIGVAGRFDTDTLRAAVADAIGRGVVIVASIGVDDVNDRLYPAAYPGVIGVAVTDKQDRRVPISNYGDTVDVAAPGADVIATTFDGRYFGGDGAAVAAAVTAGVAALVKSQKDFRPPELVEEILRISAVDLGAPGWDPYFGAGRIHAGRALALDPDGINPVPTPPPTDPAPVVPTDPPPVVPTDPVPIVPTDPPHPTDPPETPHPTSPATPTPPGAPTVAPPAFGTSTPGAPACGRPWQLTLTGLPDLSGVGGFPCPGCDGIMSSSDRFLSTLCPLEPLEVVITDGATGVRKVLWHGFIERPRNAVTEIRHVVQLCDPPPYRVTLLTTDPEHYTLCPNTPASQVIEQRNFDRTLNSRPGEGRRGLISWSFWSCAARWQP